MTLLSFSLSHRTAAVDVREATARSFGPVPDWLVRVRGTVPGLAEALVVATCHRFECYLWSADEVAAREAVRQACGAVASDLAGDGANGWVVRRNAAAAIHSCRVTAGLDSLVVGEAEIAGQVRRAAAWARDAGMLGPALERMLAGAYRASGRVRSETHLARGVTSAASAGVVLAAATIGDVSSRHVLVIGAGQAARTALGRLARLGVRRVSVASRSRRHATDAAAIVGGDVLTPDQIVSVLPDVDVVIAATTAPGYLITAAGGAWVSGADVERRRVFVDLSVPRVIDPAVASLRHVTLVSVDDLGDLAEQSVRRRAREIPRAEEIARAEGASAYARLAGRSVWRARTVTQADPLPRD